MISKAFVLAAYLLVGGLADDTDCSSDISVSNQSDLDGISSCGNFTGKIDISDAAGVLTINGLQKVGSLVGTNSSITSISAPLLEEITDSLDFEQLTALETFSMPVLTSVGDFKLVTLPKLEELQFNSGIQKASAVYIADTSLSSLSGLNLSEVTTFNINNNQNIGNVSVHITQVSNALEISFNSPKVQVSFPDLIWANNATFRNCASIDIPELQSVNESLGFFNNYVNGLSFSKLEEIGGDLSIVSNNDLSNVTFDSLTEIGGALVIANNSKLEHIAGFSELSSIKGALTIQGNFSQASMPSLENVSGDVDVESSEEFDCGDFDDAKDNNDFHGNVYMCKGASSTVSEDMSSGAQTATDSSAAGSGSGGSSAAASATGGASSSNAGFTVPVGGVSMAGLAMALFSLF